MAAPASSYESELGRVLKVMADMEYVREEDVPNIPVLAQETKHVVYAHLAETPLPPDVVILFVHSQQGLVITEAVQQVEPAVPLAMGRPACAVIPPGGQHRPGRPEPGLLRRPGLPRCAFRPTSRSGPFPAARSSATPNGLPALARANNVLGKFHTLRRQDVEAGLRPTVVESLLRLEN